MDEITEEEYELLRELVEKADRLAQRIMERRGIKDICDVEDVEDVVNVISGIYAELWHVEYEYEERFESHD